MGERLSHDTGVVHELQGKVDDLENIRSTSSGHVVISNVLEDSVKDLEHELVSLRRHVNDVSDKVNQLVSDATKDAVKFCKLGFRRAEDAFAWMDVHQPDFSFGLIIDAHIVFEHVHMKLSNDQGSTTRLQGLKKLNMTNLNQGMAFTSFDHRAPRYFTDNLVLSRTKTDDSFFDKIKTYREWNKPSFGFRDRFKMELALYAQEHKQAVSDHPLCSPGSALYNVASTSRTLAIAWIESFFLFIDDTYDELTVARFSSSKGWSLITRLALCILEDVSTPRNGVVNAFEIGDNSLICKRIFWAVIRSHDIMERYKHHSFKNDPAVSAEYVKFLVMNTGMDAIDALVKQNEALRIKVEALTGQVTIADSKSATASNAVAEQKKLILDLTKKVDSLVKSNK
jgi:hypothetical protein